MPLVLIYIPSIKNVHEAADNLYTATPFKDNTYLLKPKGIITVDRVRSKRRGIILVLLSLIMQEKTQSNILRKLNSHARYAPDSRPLRKAIRAARLVANGITRLQQHDFKYGIRGKVIRWYTIRNY